MVVSARETYLTSDSIQEAARCTAVIEYEGILWKVGGVGRTKMTVTWTLGTFLLADSSNATLRGVLAQVVVATLLTGLDGVIQRG